MLGQLDDDLGGEGVRFSDETETQHGRGVQTPALKQRRKQIPLKLRSY